MPHRSAFPFERSHSSRFNPSRPQHSIRSLKRCACVTSGYIADRLSFGRGTRTLRAVASSRLVYSSSKWQRFPRALCWVSPMPIAMRVVLRPNCRAIRPSCHWRVCGRCRQQQPARTIVIRGGLCFRLGYQLCDSALALVASLETAWFRQVPAPRGTCGRVATMGRQVRSS